MDNNNLIKLRELTNEVNFLENQYIAFFTDEIYFAIASL